MIQKFHKKLYKSHRLHKYRFILLSLSLSLLITAFIFHNSLQDSQTSNAQSSSIAEVVKPIIDPGNQVEEKTFHKLTRKLAHGIEFCILGCSAGGLMVSLKSVLRRYPVFMILFCLLSTAVADEFIQSFTGRTSNVKDILIDFSGAVVGVLLAVGIAAVVRRITGHHVQANNGSSYR